jgi:hypothetical protein
MAHKKANVSSHHTPATLHSTQDLTPEAYQRRIAEAAYYRALARGFQGGDPVSDWLEAEQELSHQSSP